jgi:hypothetical protein
MKRSLLVLGTVFLFLLISMQLQAQEKSLMLGPADLLPLEDDIDYWQNGEYIKINTSTVTYHYFYAPIHLPDGVRIKRIVVFYGDNDATENVGFYLFRENMYNGAYGGIISDTTSSGAVTGRRTLTAYANWTNNLISNGGYTYSFTVYFSDLAPSLYFYGVKIIYE